MSRSRRLLPVGVLLATVGLVAGSAAGQEFRIYTKVYDQTTLTNGRPTLIGRSLSLFHAGKVYDFIENGLDSEVTVFEPAHQRFVVLNTSRNLATTVHFDEVVQKMQLARQVTEKRIAELQAARSTDPAVLAKLAFPLDPVFREEFDESGRRLKLSSPQLDYDVRCATVEDAQTTEFYLRYADWVAQLNYVLHPHALYPQPRLALNEHLRRRGVLPVEVDLKSEIGLPIRLRAEHQIHWKLDAADRSLIHEWESLRNSELTRHVPLHEYQRSLLVSQSSRRR